MSTRPPTPPLPADVLDDLLEDYTVRRLLGHGGMGAVYLAHHTALDREVAIKVLPAELSADASFAKRFEREARSMARMDHPHIVRVHDFGRTRDGHPYFVMEFIDGCDLHHLIHNGKIDVPQALQIVTQICDALSYAHSMGIVHRDIKPSNVLIDRQGRVKIADFGLARPLEERKAESSALTQSGSVLGTLEYMAPEQLMGKPADHRADIYALGVLIYELLTGDVPRGAWCPPSGVRPMDARLDEVVQRALQPKPEDRYQQVVEVKKDVTSVLEGRPQVPPIRRSWLGVAAVVLIVVLTATLWIMQKPTPPTSAVMVTAPEPQKAEAELKIETKPSPAPGPEVVAAPPVLTQAPAPKPPAMPPQTLPKAEPVLPPAPVPVMKSAASTDLKELEMLGMRWNADSTEPWKGHVKPRESGFEIGPVDGAGALTLRRADGALLNLGERVGARWRVEAQVGQENTAAVLITLVDDAGRRRSWRLKPESFNTGTPRTHTHFLPLREADFVNAAASFGPRLETAGFDLSQVRELRLEGSEGVVHWIMLKLGITEG